MCLFLVYNKVDELYTCALCFRLCSRRGHYEAFGAVVCAV